MIRKAYGRRRRRGFTLFEVIVAMFILLMGVLGIVSVFTAGMQLRLRAQEILISHELANMWADWIRFRVNDAKPAGGALGVLHRSDLSQGKKGDFYSTDVPGDFGFSHPDPRNLPTKGMNVYQGYTWEITEADQSYKPQFVRESDGQLIPWDKRVDGATDLFTWGGGTAAIGTLTQVELTIRRGAHPYEFIYIFSGVGMKYD